MAALRREAPDRVPVWELIINEPTLSALTGRPKAEDKAETLNNYCALVELLDLDGVTWGEDLDLTSEGEYFIDEWGITWGFNPDGIPYPVTGPIKEPKDVAAYEPPDPDAPHRLRSLEHLLDRFKGDRAVVYLGHEAFEFSHYLVGGMDRLFRLYYRHPEAAHQLAEKVSEYKCRLIERAVKLGADAVVCGDDYAFAQGPFMSPATFREFILPYMKRAGEAIHQAGAYYMKHTDGNIWPLLDIFLEAGIDAIDPLEPAAGMDLGAVKERYGDRLCLVGNIDCRFLLTEASEREVVEAVKEAIAKAGPGGGYILASSNSIHPGVRPENYRAMVLAARQYGQYPLDEELVKTYRQKTLYAKIYPKFFAR